MKPRFTHPAHLVIGLGLWALWFAGVYGGLSLACLHGPEPYLLGHFSWINAMLLVATLPVITVLAALACCCWRQGNDAQYPTRHSSFVRWVGTGGYLAATIATAAVGLPMTVLPPCA